MPPALTDAPNATSEPTGPDHPFDLSLIPNNLEATDALCQSIALEAAIFAQKADADEDARFFEQEVAFTSLKYFRDLYDRNDTAAATKLLTHRVRVNFDDGEFITPSNSPNVSWSVDRHFVDMLVFVGKGIGIGAILPNQTVNGFYSITMDFNHQAKEFKAKKVKLGFRSAGSMLWIGKMPSTDDIWIAWIPKSDKHDQDNGGSSSCLSERHYRITVMFFAFVVSQIGYRDTIIHTPYPDLENANDFKQASNLLWVLIFNMLALTWCWNAAIAIPPVMACKCPYYTGHRGIRMRAMPHVMAFKCAC